MRVLAHHLRQITQAGNGPVGAVMVAEWIAAFLIGLVGSTHCLGMCGGIVGALTYSLDPATRESRWRFLLFKLAYNGGRVTSYMLAGMLVAGGAGILSAAAGATAPMVMSTVGALFLVAVGLHIGGWLPGFARIEAIGRPLWQRLEPLGRRLLPVRKLWQALTFGLVWGWLPCGLVYSALAYSLSTGDALRGALFMGFFGLGTMPALLTIGLVARGIGLRLRQPGIRRAAGVLVVLLAPMPLLMMHGGH